jgi:D-sedoheptulose 7-phosphate isomerase
VISLLSSAALAGGNRADATDRISRTKWESNTMTDCSDDIKNYFAEEISVLQKLDCESINDAMNAIVDAWSRGAIIYVFGNGGSAATASHMANDFNKGISEYLKKRFKMICLCDNIATITAVANDMSYDEIFRFQLRGMVDSNDLVVAISGSGNSRNVILGAQYAQSVGAKVVGLTGYSGGTLKELADYHMHVDVNDMQIVEDIHMVFDHMMMRVLMKRLA